jgi:hypothetical protein
MRPVVITDTERDALKKAMDYAKSHPLDTAALKAIRNGQQYPHPKECYVPIPFGINVGVTYEFQGETGERPCWHLSFKIFGARERHTINPAAAEMILNAMGLTLKELASHATFDGVLNLWFLEKPKP